MTWPVDLKDVQVDLFTFLLLPNLVRDKKDLELYYMAKGKADSLLMVDQLDPPMDNLLSALRKLVAKKDDDSEWSAMSGPQRGVRWRGGAPPLPPTWRYDKDDLRAYTKFVKKVEIWKLQVAPYMSKKEMALSLYNSLQGEAEQELEHADWGPLCGWRRGQDLRSFEGSHGAEGGVPEA